MIIDSPIISGSLILTGSAAFTGSLTLSGSMTTVGTITATTLVVQTVSSSITYSSGSNVFGNLASNTQVFTGSMYVTGAFYVASGSVGIGTTNPAAKLDVWGTILSSTSTPSNTVGAGPSIYLAANSGSSYTYLQQGIDRFIYFGFTGGSWYERLTINNVTGNVGIGTNSPSYPLDVYVNSSATPARFLGGNESIRLDTSSTSYDASIRFYNNISATYWSIIQSGPGAVSGGGMNMYTTAAYPMVFGTNNTERIRITSGGNVGIGTNNPGSALEVNGGICSSTGQLGSTKSVTISALNTSVLLVATSFSGIITARDNTNGGSGIWLQDPNGGANLISQNWVNGTYTVFYSAGNTYVQKTSGNVPVTFHYALYGN